jgi:hypothetical protein
MIECRRGEGDKPDVFSWADLRRYSIDWYRKQGLDFSGMKPKL